MDFRLVDDKEVWDKFITGQPFAQFLQSWAWGEFQKSVHRRVWRVGFFENGALIGAAQIIEHYLGLGWAYLYCPRGPILKIPNPNNQFPITELINFLKEKTSTYGEIFLRIEPAENIQHPRLVGRQAISNIPARRIRSIQPAHVLLLDLSKSEDELLRAMHEKTRYNIRLAGRKNLELRIRRQGLSSDDDFENFWYLMRETARRDAIKLHPKTYYQKMDEALSGKNSDIKYLIFNIQYLKKLLAAGIFIGFGDTFTYVHGGSSGEHRELMAPYLTHWEAIKFAKNTGYRYYDFGGVNPEDAADPDFRPKWAGISRFKKGFGGFIHSYAGAFDLSINNLGYKLYRTLKKLI